LGKSFSFDEFPPSLQETLLKSFEKLDLSSRQSIDANYVTNILTGLRRLELSWNQFPPLGQEKLKQLIKMVSADSWDLSTVSSCLSSVALLSFDAFSSSSPVLSQTLIEIHQLFLDSYHSLGIESVKELVEPDLERLQIYREFFENFLPTSCQEEILSVRNLLKNSKKATVTTRKPIPQLPPLLPSSTESVLTKELFAAIETDLTMLPIQWKENRYSVEVSYSGLLESQLFPVDLAIKEKGKGIIAFIDIIRDGDLLRSAAAAKKSKRQMKELMILTPEQQKELTLKTKVESLTKRRTDTKTAKGDSSASSSKDDNEMKNQFRRIYAFKTALYQKQHPTVPLYQISYHELAKYVKDFSHQFVISIREKVPFQFVVPKKHKDTKEWKNPMAEVKKLLIGNSDHKVSFERSRREDH
jgi:hypothetical protein